MGAPDDIANSGDDMTVSPAEVDHYGAGTTGDGRIMTELGMLPLWRQALPGYVVSGFKLATSTDLTMTLSKDSASAHEAVVHGYRVYTAEDIEFTLTDSTTTFIFLRVDISGTTGKLVEPFISLYEGTSIADAQDNYGILLGKAVTDADNITAVTDYRLSNQTVFGGVTSDGSGITAAAYGSGNWRIGTSGLDVTITFQRPFFTTPGYVNLYCSTAANAYAITSLSNTALAFTVGTSRTTYFVVSG
jgi:hypothetical protein